MEKNYPNMKLVGRQATNQDPNAAFTAVSAMLQANPDLAALWIPESGSAEGAVAAVKAAGDTLMIVHADISPTTLEEIKAGNIHMALNPNQGIQGFIGFMNTFLGAHPGLIDPFNDYKTSGYNPMQIPFVDNGFAVITKDNADSFVLEAYMEGRN
jgi:ribose transport system substrate-binding protein